MSGLVLTYSWVLFALIKATTLILIIYKSTSENKPNKLEKTDNTDDKLFYRGYPLENKNDEIDVVEDKKFIPINICILTVSDSRKKDDDISGNLLFTKAKEAGHNIINYEISKDDKESIRNKITEWSENKEIDAIITTGGTGLTGRDVTPDAIEDLFEKKIDGFSTIFHLISFQKIKTSTIQSRASAGIINNTYIFCLPGSPGAVKDAWDEILINQLDINYKPCNLIEIMDRLEE